MQNIFLNRNQIYDLNKPVSRLEPEFEETYNAWKEKPEEQHNVDAMLDKITPLIDNTIRSKQVGGDENYMRMQGKILAMKSLNRYDPTKASMATYLNQQLMPLYRKSRQQMNMLGIPDRLLTTSNAINNASSSFREEHGREPSIQELSDLTRMSVKQLKRVSQMSQPFNTGSFGAPNEDNNVRDPGVHRVIADELVDKYVLSSLTDDKISAEIYQHDMQLNNRKKLSTEALAKKLKLSPGAISQRRNKLRILANNAERDIYG